MGDTENTTYVFFWFVHCMFVKCVQHTLSRRLQHMSTFFLKMILDTFCVASNSNNTCVVALMKR